MPYEILKDGVDFDVTDEKRSTSDGLNASHVSLVQPSKPLEKSQLNVEESSKAKRSLLWEYLVSGNNACLVLLFFGTLILAQVFGTVIDWWVAFWTEQEELKLNSTKELSQESLPLETDWCAIIYGILMGCLILAGFVRVLLFLQLMFRSGQTLHNGMFKGISAVCNLGS